MQVRENNITLTLITRYLKIFYLAANLLCFVFPAGGASSPDRPSSPDLSDTHLPPPPPPPAYLPDDEHAQRQEQLNKKKEELTMRRSVLGLLLLSPPPLLSFLTVSFRYEKNAIAA